METKVTEKIIGRANLSSEEAKVARYFYKLTTAGKRTNNWVRGLNSRKQAQLLTSAEEKIQKVLKGAEE